MRRSDHPSRPSAITCSRFSALKTLAIPAAGAKPTAQVNVSAPGAALAGFQVSINGRFWVSTEAHFHTDVLIRLNVRTRPRFREPLCERHWCRSTPGVLGSGPSSVVSVHRRLLRPHPPVSQARGDFTALPLIRRAFAVRERRGDPRDLPYFPWRPVPACRRPYAGGFAVAFPLCTHRDARLPRGLTESPPTSARLCQQCPTGSCISALHRSLHAAARVFARPSWLATTRCDHVFRTSPAEAPCHSSFRRRSSPSAVGSQAKGANGKSPLVRTFTRPVHGR